MKIPSRILLVAFCLCASIVNAQQGIYKDTIYVPVTFYDFHSNGSNPEFEPPFFAQSPKQNMVSNTLDADGKPVVGSNINQNQYVKYWFRPWKDSIANDPKRAQGDYTIPVYTQTGGAPWAAQIRYDGTRTVNYDTAFKNVVIQGTLAFHHIGGGMYQYENTSFFPLDNMGLGNETRAHNFSFTMELKWQFQKKTGQTFDFSGDDDVWAFVNNQLKMDLGGIHGTANGNFTIDPTIPEDSICTLNVFYAERHTDASDIKITTNIISPKLSIHVEPNSSICLGDTVITKAQISSGTQVITKLPAGGTLTWHLSDPLNPASTFMMIDSTSRRFVPTKPSIAKIWGEYNEQARGVHITSDTATIIVKLCIGAPDSMNFYDTAGDPKTMTPLKDTISVNAGDHKIVYAKLFDSLQHSWLSQYEQVDSLANRFQWTVSDTKNATILAKGSHADFYSTVAYNNYILTAILPPSTTNPTNRLLRRSVVIKVLPGTPRILIIEPNHDGSTASPNHPQYFQDTTITIQSNETVKTAYAVLRDIWGNFVRFSNPTDWVIDPPKIAHTDKGDTNFGEVRITRDSSSGLTKVHATDTKTNLTGWAYLSIVNYFYKELKIVVKQNIAGKDTLVSVNSLSMPSDQDTVLYVIGLRSDNGKWEQTTVNWEVSSSLNGTVIPFPNVNNMNVSPKDTGTGWIRVTKGNDAVTVPDTINVKFTQPTAFRDSIVIITPPEKRIAGDPITAIVKIFDRRGKLIPGLYCFHDSTVYQDTLGSKGGFEPIVKIDSVTDTINKLPSTAHSTSECFNGGLDTVTMYLYNAPVAPDSVHKIFVHLGNVPVAYTDPFHLYPGKIDRLDIENANGSSVEDTVTLNAPGDSKMFYAAGFDHWGNRITNPVWAPSNWSVSGNLHAVNGQNVGQIYYETATVTVNESGYLTASVADTSAPLYVKDSVFIKILGPAISLTRAITRDIDGNGYLDHIELHFALPVTLPANFSFSGLSITNGSTTFTPAGIENNIGRTDTVWSIKINEVQNNIPQTAWKPYISFDRNDAVSIVGAPKVQCQDGAGPVVWAVVDSLGKAPNHTEDVITVTLSEPVMRSSGSSLALSDTPSVVFYVWQKNPKDSFVIVDKILVGINNFTNVYTTTKDPKQTVVSFKMTNTNDLTSNYFMNINTGKMYISDNAQPQNLPNLNNQKVRVKLIAPPINPYIYPNPASPDGRRIPLGELDLNHDPGARQYLQSGGGGAVITFNIFVPPVGTGIKTRCYLKVYDAVGNLVIQAKQDDMLKTLPQDVLNGNKTTFPIDLYWNGSTAQKSKAAPGVYMAVLYVEYWGGPAASDYNAQIRAGNKYPFTCLAGIKK